MKDNFFSKAQESIESLQKYLSSKFFRGIGKVIAERITAAFGEKTIEIVEQDPSRLEEEVKGIGKKRAAMLIGSWERRPVVRLAIHLLLLAGLSVIDIIRIIDRYAEATLSISMRSPFQIEGIGFRTASKIASLLGASNTADARIDHAILDILARASGDGHTCLTMSSLLKRLMRLLAVDKTAIRVRLDALTETGKIIVDDILNPNGRVIGKAVYLPHLHDAETQAAANVLRILNGGTQKIAGNAISVTEIAKSLGMSLSPEQIGAVELAARSKMLLLIGGPGTGKSTVIRVILEVQKSEGRKALLAAPTGKAAKRVAETTGYEAMTVHRLLKFHPGSNSFRINEHKRLQADVVVIDEASMLDIQLFSSLLKATRAEATLILVGDFEQLPSVGPGNVLKDLMSSRSIPVAQLRRVYRQAAGSLIIKNAMRIREGMLPVDDNNSMESDYYFLEVNEPDRIIQRIVDLCTQWIPKKMGSIPIQVLTPKKKGKLGTNNLNAVLQHALVGKGGTVTSRGMHSGYLLGDKVMQTVNNYSKGVYNGEIGIVLQKNGLTGDVTVDFEGRRIVYPPKEHGELGLAHCLTVHKAQGSEYQVVVLPIHPAHGVMLQRNLLYTAITRGKKLVCVVGSSEAIALAVANDKSLRKSYLSRRISNAER